MYSLHNTNKKKINIANNINIKQKNNVMSASMEIDEFFDFEDEVMEMDIEVVDPVDPMVLCTPYKETTLEELLSKQKATVSSLRTEIITIRKGHKKEMDLISELELQNKFDIESLRYQLGNSRKQVSSSSSKIKELYQEIEQLKSQYEQKEDEVNSLAQSLQKSQDQCSNLTTKNNALSSDLKLLEEKHSASLKMERELSTLVSSLQEEQQHYTKKDNQNQVLITNLEKDNRLLKESKAAVEKDLHNTRDELQNLQQKHDTQKTQYEKTVTCLHEKEDEVKILKEKMVAMEMEAGKKIY